jgi:hypothetical protein
MSPKVHLQLDAFPVSVSALPVGTEGNVRTKPPFYIIISAFELIDDRGTHAFMIYSLVGVKSNSGLS